MFAAWVWCVLLVADWCCAGVGVLVVGDLFVFCFMGVNSVGIVARIGLCVYLLCYCSLGVLMRAGFGDFVWLGLVFDLLVARFVL